MDTLRERKLTSIARTAPARTRWSSSLKRAFDVIASFLGMIMLLPFFLPVAALIRRESPGPIFYRGPRVGKYGKTFDILKFRTMHEAPESYNGPRVTAKDDERVTPFGRWLRETKLNELPQLWNVFIGEMSLVGPRPEDPEIVKTWPADAREEILSIRPGITSPASVLYRDEESLLSSGEVMRVYLHDIMPDKLRLDRLYVRNHSFLGDLDILFWTFASLLPVIAHQQVPESHLFAGPLYRFVRRHVSWFVVDLVTCMLVIAAAGSAWRLFQPINWGVGPLAALALILALLFSSMNVFLGLDRVAWSRASAEDALILTASNIMTLLVILFANYFQKHRAWLPLPALPTELIVTISVLTLVGSLLARYRMRLITSFASRWLSWRKEGGFGERVLILGAGEGGQIVNWLLRRGSLHRAITVVGMVDDDPAKQGMSIDGCRVLGGSGELSNLVSECDVGVILFTISNVPAETRESLVKLCQIPGVRLVFLNNIMDTITRQLSQ